MAWNNPFRASEAKVNQQQTQQTQQQSQNQQQTQQNRQQQSGTIPNKQQQTQQTQQTDDPNKTTAKTGEGDDPMLQFESLWQPNTDKDGKVIPSKNSQQSSYLPQLDPKKFGDMVEKMDFTRHITKEERAALVGGGEGAVEAMLSVMNKSHRQNFINSISAMSRLVENGFSGAQGRFADMIPDHVRNLMAEDSLNASSGIMRNPAFAPLVRGVKNQFLDKYPKATPSQINTAVEAYFENMYQEMHAGKTQKQTPTRRDNTDKLKTGDQDADFMQWIESEVGQQALAKAGVQE